MNPVRTGQGPSKANPIHYARLARAYLKEVTDL